MIRETPPSGLAVMMLAVAAAAVVQQVSRNLYCLSSLSCSQLHTLSRCFVSTNALTLFGLTIFVAFYSL